MPSLPQHCVQAWRLSLESPALFWVFAKALFQARSFLAVAMVSISAGDLSQRMWFL